MTKRNKDWVYIVEPNGQQKIASPDYIKNLLGLDVELYNLKDQIRDLKHRVRDLEAPKRQDQVLNELEKQPRSYGFLKGVITDLGYSDIHELEHREIITRYTAGNNKTMLSIVTHETRSEVKE